MLNIHIYYTPSFIPFLQHSTYKPIFRVEISVDPDSIHKKPADLDLQGFKKR